MLVRSLHRSLVAFFAHFLGLLNESAATATATLVAARPPAHEADIVYVGNSSIGPVAAPTSFALSLPIPNRRPPPRRPPHLSFVCQSDMDGLQGACNAC